MIRPLTREDYNQWLPLWRENCLGQVSDEVTAETWQRICHPKEPVYALGIFTKEKDAEKLQGFLHYVLHPTTGFTEYACYMQDLFVAPEYRGQGLAKLMIWELNEIGQKESWARIYWFAEKGNEAAQSLYKNLGIPDEFQLTYVGNTSINQD